MKLWELIDISSRVSSTQSRKEKVDLMARLLGKCRGRDIELSSLYLSGHLGDLTLGVGWHMWQEASSNLTTKGEPPTLEDVDRYLREIANLKGPGARESKTRVLRGLLQRANTAERTFLQGLLLGELRQGALEGLVLEAISEASGIPLDSLRRALMFAPHIGEVARAALEGGTAALDRFGPQLFRPVSPMLASGVRDESEAIDRLKEAALEFKIDGARIQLHKHGDEIRIFSRHLRDVTSSLPEVVEMAKRLDFSTAILDGEVIAMEGHRPLPFQVTMRRFGRVQDVEKLARETPLSSFFFDLLYLEGEALMERPYEERVNLLSKGVPRQFLIPRTTARDPESLRAFLSKSLEAGHEGVMAKGIHSPYIAGSRGFLWLKIKPAQTLDLVVLAAEWGHGRRKGLLSNIHLGALDPSSGRYIMLGKTFKGLTDEMLHWLTRRLLSLQVKRDEFTVYVRPELVVEVAFSDIQESPRYEGGLALRFARVRRFRPDKSPLQADTFPRVKALFEDQKTRQSGTSS
jgi:DNA ligase-1